MRPSLKNPPQTLEEISAYGQEFWRRRSRQFHHLCKKHPEYVRKATEELSEDIMVHGVRTTLNLEELVIRQASPAELRQFAGGFGKGEASSPAREFVHRLYYRTWDKNPTQYCSIGQFCNYASERLQTHKIVVKPGTIRQWFKEFGFKRPRCCKTRQ